MRSFASVFLSFSLFLFTACSQLKNPFAKQSAPGSKRNVNKPGLIASCVDPVAAAAFAKEYKVDYRIIDEGSRIVEFYNVNSAVIQKSFPHSKLKKNKVYSVATVEKYNVVNAQSNAQNYPYQGAHIPQYMDPSQTGFFPHLAQVNADELQNTNQGSNVVVAVIDTGVYYNHPHLSPNIRTNSADPHGSMADGSDGDGNGYADDYVGYDFFNNDPYPIDDNGHGTHVAGIVASTFSGIAPKAKILPIKVLNENGEGDLGTIVRGIVYAINNGAHIINLSLGGPGSDINSDVQDLISKVKLARDNNTLLVSAAGNGGYDGVGDCNDAQPIYPASIQENNMVAVASVDATNQLTSYSNYGKVSVHVAAPGGDPWSDGGILSTSIPYCPGGVCGSNDTPYVRMAGTSMATPVVAGVLALMKSESPGSSYADLRSRLFSRGKHHSNLDPFISTGKVVDAANSL
ncbi:S8 family serine peptidase [Bacteriovoracaceae bacterium]|nr:S8 family serine peptidase [Bacteriovoracaceae bacterium]